MRKFNFYLHSILGLGCSLFLIIAGLTGAILVFEEEINEARHSNWYHVPQEGTKKSLDEVDQIVRTSFPGFDIAGIKIPSHETETYQLRLYQDGFFSYAFVHPTTGEVLGHDTHSWRLWFIRLHYALLLGDWGTAIMFIPAVGMVVLAITGLWIHRAAWKAMLTLPPFHRGPRLALSHLHKMTGVPLYFFLLILGLTGAWFNWSSFERISQGKASPVGVKSRSPGYQKSTTSLDLALQKSKEALSDFNPGFVGYPTKRNPSLLILGSITHQGFFGRGGGRIEFDSTTGNIKKTQDIRTLPWNEKWKRFIVPLHFGNFGGWIIKLIYCLGSLGVVVLSITGTWIWIKRKRKKGKEIQFL